jgi:hypothetical protein
VFVSTARFGSANRRASRLIDEKGTVMKKIFAVSALVIGFGLFGLGTSSAMPLAPLGQAASGDTIQVAGGCGWGWHRGPYGGCRPMYNCPPG